VSNRTNGSGPTIPEPFQNYLLSRRPNHSTAVNPVNLQRPCEHSAQHSRALIRHVDRLGGRARDLCRACLLQIVASEARDAVRREFARLFHLWPLGFLRGAALARRISL
jgi:hypothetical protein